MEVSGAGGIDTQGPHKSLVGPGYSWLAVDPIRAGGTDYQRT